MSRLLTYGILSQGRGVAETALKTNLLGCWEINETSGTSLADAHGSKNLTTVNSPTLGATGIIGNAITLSGTNQYARRNDTTLYPTTAISVSAWVKRSGSGTGATNTIISRYWSGSGLRSFVVDVHPTTHQIRWFYQGTNNAWGIAPYTPASDIWTGNWVHVVCTRLNSSMKIYLDGVNVYTGSHGNGIAQSTGSPSVYFQIGAVSRSSTTPDAFWNGLIDQCAIWDRELSQTDVDDLYNSGAGRAYSSW